MDGCGKGEEGKSERRGQGKRHWCIKCRFQNQAWRVKKRSGMSNWGEIKIPRFSRCGFLMCRPSLKFLSVICFYSFAFSLLSAHIFWGLCNFASVFDNSEEGSNRIIARVDNSLHLHPQRLLVAKVTSPCVNTFPPEGRHLPEWILPWLCRFSFFSFTSRQTESHARKRQRRGRAADAMTRMACLLYTVFNEYLMFPQVFPRSTRASPVPHWKLIFVLILPLKINSLSIHVCYVTLSLLVKILLS